MCVKDPLVSLELVFRNYYLLGKQVNCIHIADAKHDLFPVHSTHVVHDSALGHIAALS